MAKRKPCFDPRLGGNGPSPNPDGPRGSRGAANGWVGYKSGSAFPASAILLYSGFVRGEHAALYAFYRRHQRAAMYSRWELAQLEYATLATLDYSSIQALASSLLATTEPHRAHAARVKAHTVFRNRQSPETDGTGTTLEYWRPYVAEQSVRALPYTVLHAAPWNGSTMQTNRALRLIGVSLQ